MISNTEMKLEESNESKESKESKESQKKTQQIDLNQSTVDHLPTNLELKNMDGIEYLSSIPIETIDLILTDPPYIISKETGMNAHYNKIKQNEEENITFVKTEEEWNLYKSEYEEKGKEKGKEKEKEKEKKKKIKLTDSHKEQYMKYGTIYGKKYCVKTNYGDWDNEFTIEKLEEFICEFYKKLKKGGTIIIFCDLWKISYLKVIMEKYKFKQIRFIEWIKTNPQPLNSSLNYLTNSREVALLGVKGSKPTFHSKYDNGIYNFPLQGGKNRFHPTQKSLLLFEELIKKHSNENDIVLDTFVGGGTTAIACKNTNRNFKGCEISSEYFDKVMKLL